MRIGWRRRDAGTQHCVADRPGADRAHIGQVGVEVAVRPQHAHEQRRVLGGERQVERFLRLGLGQQFGDEAARVGLDHLRAHRSAAKGLGRMEIGGAVFVDERLERDPERPAVAEDRVMVVRQPRGGRS